MIVKGGHGSGIRGHRTIRDVIAGMDGKAKLALLSRLKDELDKRKGGTPVIPTSKPTEKSKQLPIVKLSPEELKKKKELDQADDLINSPDVLSLLKIPEELTHVTTMERIDSIKKNGLMVNKDRVSTEGFIRGVYFSDNPNDIVEHQGDMKVSRESAVVVTIKTKGLTLRLDPEFFYYDDKTKKGAKDWVESINDGFEAYALYSRDGIPASSIVSIKPLYQRKGADESASKQTEDLIAKIITRVKEKLTEQKEVSKEDWIEAWKDNPHWDKREPSKLVNRLLDETDKKKVLNVLELGCGNGVDSIAFGEKGHKVAGIDISPDAIKLAKKNNKFDNVTFEVGDAEKLKFKDNQFDLVYSMAVLHSSDLKKSIPELARVLKPGGKALLFLYQKTEYEYNDETEKNFAYGEIEGLFKDNGLKVLSKDKTEKKDKDENGIHWHYSVVYILEKT